jgi:hypothetical protein
MMAFAVLVLAALWLIEVNLVLAPPQILKSPSWRSRFIGRSRFPMLRLAGHLGLSEAEIYSVLGDAGDVRR